MHNASEYVDSYTDETYAKSNMTHRATTRRKITKTKQMMQTIALNKMRLIVGITFPGDAKVKAGDVGR